MTSQKCRSRNARKFAGVQVWHRLLHQSSFASWLGTKGAALGVRCTHEGAPIGPKIDCEGGVGRDKVDRSGLILLRSRGKLRHIKVGRAVSRHRKCGGERTAYEPLRHSPRSAHRPQMNLQVCQRHQVEPLLIVCRLGDMQRGHAELASANGVTFGALLGASIPTRGSAGIDSRRCLTVGASSTKPWNSPLCMT